jgi:uncharacterized protein (TIGR03435 family)
MPFEAFLRFLSTTLRTPILDKTGLEGSFDIKLQWRPDIGENGPFPPSSTAINSLPDGPSLFTALQEQLGLKLESGRGPVDVLVIDSVQRPTEN